MDEMDQFLQTKTTTLNILQRNAAGNVNPHTQEIEFIVLKLSIKESPFMHGFTEDFYQMIKI